MKQIYTVLMLILLSTIIVNAQTFKFSDSLSISQDLREAYLHLQFSDTLRITGTATDSIPFNFFIMSPKDSINIVTSTHSLNETGSQVAVKFSITPETSFSLLVFDAFNDENLRLDKPIVINFNTYSSTIVKTDTLQFNYGLVVCPEYGDFRSVTITGLLPKRAGFTELKQTDFENGSVQSQLIDVTSLFNFKDETFQLVSSYPDSVSVVSFYSVYLPTGEITNYILGDVKNSSSSNGSLNYNTFAYFKDEIKVIGHYIICSSIEENTATPALFTISSAYPNPFNPSTTLTFSVANSSSISFSVYDILGRRIQSLEHKDVRYSAGTHSLMYDFSGLPSGTYFIEAIGTELGSGQVSRQVAKVSLMK